MAWMGVQRVVEVGLHDAVVAGEELELDHVARVGLEVVWVESQTLVGRRDRDDVDRLCGGQARQGSCDNTG